MLLVEHCGAELAELSMAQYSKTCILQAAPVLQ